MIKQKFTLDRRYWKVYVYYNVHRNDTTEVLKTLKDCNLPESYISSAYTMLKRSRANDGATYSNILLQKSVIIINHTSEASEFINSIGHEAGHLTTHIALKYNINYLEEEFCYILGDILQEMYKSCNKLLCDRCNNDS